MRGAFNEGCAGRARAAGHWCELAGGGAAAGEGAVPQRFARDYFRRRGQDPGVSAGLRCAALYVVSPCSASEGGSVFFCLMTGLQKHLFSIHQAPCQPYKTALNRPDLVYCSEFPAPLAADTSIQQRLDRLHERSPRADVNTTFTSRIQETILSRLIPVTLCFLCCYFTKLKSLPLLL